MIPPLPTTRDDTSQPAREPDLVKLAATLVIATIIVAALYLGQVVLIPLAVAFLISFVLGPLVSWLARHRIPRVGGVALAMLLVLAVLGGLGMLVAMQVTTLSQELPTYQSTIRAKIESLGAQMEGPGVFTGVLETFDTVQQEVAEVVGGGADSVDALERVRVVPEPVSPFATAIQWLTPLLAPVATFGIVLVFVVLILLDTGDLRDRLLRMLGGNLFRSTDALEEAGKRISKYLLMQLTVNVTYGIPMALGLYLIGVPGWILWGTLAAVMRFIPYVGPILSAVFPLSLAFAVDPGWEMVIYTAALILVLELVSNNIVEPLLYGTSTGLSALSLIAAATFWTAIWGPMGLVLSTPLTVCLLVVGRYIPQLSVLETLLGSSPALSRQTRIYQRLIAADPDDALDIAEEAIEEGSVTEFYSDEGMDVLRQASADYINNARAEHRLRFSSGMDELLEELREEYPDQIPADAPPRVACIAGKWEIDRQACEMLSHSLRLAGIAATERGAGTITSRRVDALELAGVEVVLLSFFSSEPDTAARSLTRRIRARWPQVKIVLGLWNVPLEELTAARRESLGADAITASIEEAVQRVTLMVSRESAKAIQVVQDPQAAATRDEVLRGVSLSDPDLREDLDDIAKRAADVFDMEMAAVLAIEAQHELVVGASRDLPGARTSDGRDLVLLPHGAPIASQLLDDGTPWMVPDIEREPTLAENAVLRTWAVRSLAAAPLRQSDGVILGALCLMHDEIRELDDDELRLLETLAAEAAERLTGEVPAPVSTIPPEPPSALTGQKVPN